MQIVCVEKFESWDSPPQPHIFIRRLGEGRREGWTDVFQFEPPRGVHLKNLCSRCSHFRDRGDPKAVSLSLHRLGRKWVKLGSGSENYRGTARAFLWTLAYSLQLFRIDDVLLFQWFFCVFILRRFWNKSEQMLGKLCEKIYSIWIVGK